MSGQSDNRDQESLATGNGVDSEVEKCSESQEEAIESSSSAVQANKNNGLTGQQILKLINNMDGDIKKLAAKQAKLAGEDVKDHKFWNTQPVPQRFETVAESGPIEVKSVDEVRKEPYNMPAGFEWVEIDVNDPEQIAELYTLLTENYVEDDDCHFRFDYSIPFLHWALTPPGYLIDWHVGVRNNKTKKLMGSITAIPAQIKIGDNVVPMVEINFLCVHKKLRDKRLAPVLIKEITRRVNLRNIWQATYTAGVVLPKPVARCRYYHRSLNPKKLIEAKFSYLPQRMTMAAHIKNLKIRATPRYGWVPMRPEHVPSALALVTDYLDSYGRGYEATHECIILIIDCCRNTKLRMVFSHDEFAHIFIPRETVVSSYVIESTTHPGEVTDFCSFYHLPSTIIATSMSFVDLMADALTLAQSCGVDVFNALDAMENSSVMDELKFGIGDGFLQYYLYNWKYPEMPSKDVGLILL